MIVRLPKLYEGDDHRSFIRPFEGRLCAYSNAFRDAREFPWAYGLPADLSGERLRYTDIVEMLTGYSAVAVSGPVRDDGWWFLEGFDQRQRGPNPKPVVDAGYGRRVYYRRDITAQLLPRWRCVACQRKPRGQRPDAETYRGFFYCSKRCQRFETSPIYALLTDKEQRVWREHMRAPVCSLACHERMESQYRRITLDLKEKRLWIRQGKQLLNEILEKLPENSQPRMRRQRASESRRTESRLHTTSAT